MSVRVSTPSCRLDTSESIDIHHHVIYAIGTPHSIEIYQARYGAVLSLSGPRLDPPVLDVASRTISGPSLHTVGLLSVEDGEASMCDSGRLYAGAR